MSVLGSENLAEKADTGGRTTFNGFGDCDLARRAFARFGNRIALDVPDPCPRPEPAAPDRKEKPKSRPPRLLPPQPVQVFSYQSLY